jgi:hypothetical protein
MGFWIDFFQDLEFQGHLDKSNEMDVDLCRFIFGPMIAQNLHDFKTNWNSHRVRKSRNSLMPAGTPDLLHAYPEIHGEFQQMGRPLTNFRDLCERTFGIIDDHNPFGIDDWNPILSPILTQRNLYPITLHNMTAAYLHLREAVNE